MRVLLVTSARERCGIHEYGAMLTEAMRSTHPDVELRAISPDVHGALDLVASLAGTDAAFDLVHVNHQAALHSSWTTDHIATIRGDFCPVVVTHHDTFESLQILLDRDYPFFFGLADHVVVHEPIPELPAAGRGAGWTYLRQPIPAATLSPVPHLPLTVGSVGFDFPWKNFDRLRHLAGHANWRTDIFGGADDWVPRDVAIARLAGCHATAFLYQTGNSGTSAAIRLGIAAGKPVIASPCRQFRDLHEAEEPEVRDAVIWARSDQEFLTTLDRIAGLNDAAWFAACNRVRRLAELDSWKNGAEVYYRIYERVLAERITSLRAASL
jgi:hypothetical protein